MVSGRFVKCSKCGKLNLWGQECAKCSDPTDGNSNERG